MDTPYASTSIAPRGGPRRLAALAACIALAAASAPAQSLFENAPSFQPADRPGIAYDLDVADFDGDGVHEVVRFDREIDSGIENFVSTLNRDMAAGGLDWSPSSAFDISGSPIDHSSSSKLPTLRHADFDGDGRLDRVVIALASDPTQYHIEVFQGLDDVGGSFESKALLLTNGLAIHSADIGDIDGDGDLDVMAFGLHERRPVFTLFFNHGGASFEFDQAAFYPNGAPSPEIPPLPFDHFFVAAMGDIDGDGDLDLATQPLVDTLSPLTFQLFRNDGPLGFHPLPASEPSGFANWMGFADYDADGDLDLLATVYAMPPLGSPAGLLLFRNNGSSGLEREARRVAALTSSSGEPANTFLADVDGDDLPDVVLAQERYFQIAKHGGLDPSGTPLPAVVAEHTLLRYNFFGYGLDDADADGDLDILISSHRGLGVARNMGGAQGGELGRFELPAVYNSYSSLGTPGDGIAEDWNGDGLLDCLAPLSSRLATFTQQPDGAFSMSVTPRVQNGTPLAFATADFDGDGVRDAITHFNRSALLFRGVAALPDFEPAVQLYGIDGVSSMETLVAMIATDLDRDGDPDLVAAFEDRGEVYDVLRIALNERETDPLSMFNGPPIAEHLLVPDPPGPIVAQDYDGDGDVDIACFSEDLSISRLAVNQGGAQGGVEGTFAVDPSPNAGLAPPAAPPLVDWDGDGDGDDLANEDGYWSVRPDLGGAQGGTAGEFGPAERYFIAATDELVRGDFDGDGAPDLFAPERGYFLRNSTPQVAEARFSGPRAIDVAFTEPMSDSALDPANYALSGDGVGTLAASPDRVDDLGGGAYRLWWDAGEFADSEQTQLTAGFEIRDLVGNRVGFQRTVPLGRSAVGFHGLAAR